MTKSVEIISKNVKIGIYPNYVKVLTTYITSSICTKKTNYVEKSLLTVNILRNSNYTLWARWKVSSTDTQFIWVKGPAEDDVEALKLIVQPCDEDD